MAGVKAEKVNGLYTPLCNHVTGHVVQYQPIDRAIQCDLS